MPDTTLVRPPAWSVLAQALAARLTVRARYHGHDRLLCPHVLGWKNGRAKVLAFQSDGTTSSGALSDDSQQRWRSLFVDEIEHASIALETPWQSAHNYTPYSNCIDKLELAVDP
jgi:hypothetical protein